MTTQQTPPYWRIRMLDSVYMKQMVILSTGVHLLFLALLFGFHYINLPRPRFKPHILSVELVTLPQSHVEKKKTGPVEAVKKIETVSLPKAQKKSIPFPKSHLKPVSRTAASLPAPPQTVKKEAPAVPVLPVQPKAEEPPPVVEAKKEEAVQVPEPQKVEIAQISTIDPNYVERVKRKVELNWNPPTFTGIPKQVTISFEILKSGLVKNPRIIKSSGDLYFDNAARRAVFEARSFGPLPADYTSLLVEISCSFSQNKGS